MSLAVYIALLIASMVISAALAPTMKPPPPTAFDDFDFPLAEEGTPQCVVFGDCWSGDWMVLGVGNYQTRPVKTDGGKK
jgi:hypothetical protein